MPHKYKPVNREFDIRNWGFRRSYPTGIKLSGDALMICKKCSKTFGRHGRPLPLVLQDGEFDYCDNYIEGQRCMCREYEVLDKIELEAMPIGRVTLPSGRQGTWTHRGK